MLRSLRIRWPAHNAKTGLTCHKKSESMGLGNSGLALALRKVQQNLRLRQKFEQQIMNGACDYKES